MRTATSSNISRTTTRTRFTTLSQVSSAPQTHQQRMCPPSNNSNRNSSNSNCSNSSKDKVEIHNTDMGGHSSNEERSRIMEGGNSNNTAGSNSKAANNSNNEAIAEAATQHDLHQNINSSSSNNRLMRLSMQCNRLSLTFHSLRSSQRLLHSRQQRHLHRRVASITQITASNRIKRHPTHPHLCTPVWMPAVPDGTAARNTSPANTNPAHKNSVRLMAATVTTHTNASSLTTRALRT